MKKNISIIVIFILSLLTLTFSILYFNEQNKDVDEYGKQEKVKMYLYDLEVKKPLTVISFFLGIQSVESIDWEEADFRKDLQSLFRELDEGLRNIDYYDPQIVPTDVLVQLQHLKEKVSLILININREKPLDEQTTVDIMGLSKSVYDCEINVFTEDWKQVETKLKCLNEATVN